MQANLEIPHEPISVFLVEEPLPLVQLANNGIYKYISDSDKMHFPESPKIKVEVKEIKTEPCDVSSEESGSLYNHFTTSEDEDVSSDKRHHYSFLNGEMMLLHIYENQLKDLAERNVSKEKEVDNSSSASSSLYPLNNTSSEHCLILPNVTKPAQSDVLCNNSRKVHVVPINSHTSKNIKVNVLSLPKNKIVGDSDSNPETGTLQDNITKMKRTSVRSSRKRKLHEISDPLSDEEEERRRIGAINAKKNREDKKLQFDMLSQELHKEKGFNASLRTQLKSLGDEKKIALLEKENAELKYQILLDKYTKLLKLHNLLTKPT